MTDIEEIIETISECTEAQWEEEMKARWIEVQLPVPYVPMAFGTTLPCPCCGTIGFYGPRKDPQDNPTRKYRACKFCGFWQEVWGKGFDEKGGKSYRCVTFYCENCRALNSYGWEAVYESTSCPNCPGVVRKETKWASDNPQHPFHRIKESILAMLNQ